MTDQRCETAASRCQVTSSDRFDRLYSDRAVNGPQYGDHWNQNANRGYADEDIGFEGCRKDGQNDEFFDDARHQARHRPTHDEAEHNSQNSDLQAEENRRVAIETGLSPNAMDVPISRRCVSTIRAAKFRAANAAPPNRIRKITL